MLALLVVLCLFVPLFSATVFSVSNPEFGSLVSNLIRVASHLALFTIGLLFLCGLKCNITSINYRYFIVAVVIFVLSAISFISVYANGLGATAYFRSFMMLLYMINYLLLFKILFSGLDSDVFVKTLSTLFMYCVFLFSLFTITISFNGHSPYTRLGYPLIPGVFAFYCMIAFTISITVRKNIWLACSFLVMVFMSGSRSAMILSVIILVWHHLRKRTGVLKIVFLFAVTLLSILFIPDLYDLFIRVVLSKRADISAGRIDVWYEAVQLIFDKPYLGWGERPIFVVSGGLKELRAHNTFLELAATYGLFYAILTYSVWIGIFYPHKRFSNLGELQYRKNISDYGLILFWLVTIKSLVTTTFWTNMGDPAVQFVMLVLLAILSSRKITFNRQMVAMG